LPHLGYIIRLDPGSNPPDTIGGRVVELRMPYPIGFYAKSIDGHIDDPNAGWKGRGLWFTSGNRTPVHIEDIDAPAPARPAKRRQLGRALWS
jgi:hypothetical protein